MWRCKEGENRWLGGGGRKGRSKANEQKKEPRKGRKDNRVGQVEKKCRKKLEKCVIAFSRPS